MWSDAESKVDYLNFSEIAESIADIVCEPELLPISIGVFGNWGAGKSTILNLTKQTIESRELEYEKKFIHVTFDAWLFQGYDDARTSILETISEHLLKEVNNDKSLLDKVKAFSKRINILRALGSTADVGATLMGLPTFGAIGYLAGRINSGMDLKSLSDEDKGQLKASVGEISQMIKPAERKSPPQEIMAFREEYSSLLEEIGRPMIVYIDNLDRCKPIDAIQTLEAIRLFLFMPNTAFIIATDEDMVRAAVKEYHKGSTPTHHADYLDKLIQVPVNVPKPGVLETRSYLFMLLATHELKDPDIIESIQEKIESSLQLSWKNDPVKVEHLLVEIQNETEKNRLRAVLNTADYMASLLAKSSNIMGNPRIIKRLLNTVSMRKKVADRRGMGLDESIIMKLAIFERCLSDEESKYLYHLIDEEKGKPSILSQLESQEQINDKNWGKWTDGDTKKFIKEWAALKPFLSGIDLRGAAYLSRETLPLSYIGESLSYEAKQLVDALLLVKRKANGMSDQIKTVSRREYILIMQEILNELRSINDWKNKPTGFAGAEMLAELDASCNSLFLSFLREQPSSAWLDNTIKRLDK